MKNEYDEPLLIRKSIIDHKDIKDDLNVQSFARFRVFAKLSLPYFRENRQAQLNLIILVLFTLINSASTVAYTYIKSGIFNGLNNRDTEMFYRYVLYFIGLLLVAVPLAVYYKYILSTYTHSLLISLTLL